jgi:hypothetical protein
MIRCSYCGARGHNKRTCPSRPVEQKEYERQYHNIPRGPSGTVTRTCSVCGEEGHNAKTCPTKKQQLRDIQKEFRDTREHFVNAALIARFDVGSLVEKTVEDVWDRKVTKKVGLVTAILWDRIGPRAFESYNARAALFGFAGLEKKKRKISRCRLRSTRVVPKRAPLLKSKLKKSFAVFELGLFAFLATLKKTLRSAIKQSLLLG